MARVQPLKQTAMQTADPTLADTRRELAHDLNGEWGTLSGATYFLEQETNLPADKEQLEAMQRRATQRLQAILAQLAQHFPHQASVDQLASTLSQWHETPLSTARLEQLTPLVNAVKQLL